MGGLLTGGAGTTSSSDITYATPLYFLKKRIAQKFKTPHFDPVFSNLNYWYTSQHEEYEI